MRYITLDKAKPGDILMSDVFDTSGHVMIVAGTELTEKYIEPNMKKVIYQINKFESEEE